MIEILNLGQISYRQGLEIQADLVYKRQRSLIPDTFIFCEHPPTLTAGIRATSSGLLASMDQQSGLSIVRTDRGGEWTAHEPGQLVLYAVVDIRVRRLSPRLFVDVLLSTTCSSLEGLLVDSIYSTCPAGIFVGGRKLGSIGLKISRGVTFHGISLNVSNSLEIFRLIVPCGLTDTEMTSVSRELGTVVETSLIASIIGEQLQKRFGD